MDTPNTLSSSERDASRIQITARLLSAVMSGHMARGLAVENAVQGAEKFRDACLVAASNLHDANYQDFPAPLAKERLQAATELFSAGVAGLVARGEAPDAAMKTVARSREAMLRTANGMVRAAVETPETGPRRELDRSVVEAYRAGSSQRGPSRGHNPGF